jgi:WLM domain
MLSVAAAVVGVAIVSQFMGPTNTVRMMGPDGHEYDIQNLPDKENAVKLMAKIRGNLTKLRDYYAAEPALMNDPPVARFVARFQADVFSENDIQSSDTSYSENKGQRIVVCLRDKTKPPYPLVEINTVMFVMLHEMSHLMTETIGHTPEFWENFRRILHDAVKIGIYTPVNYSRQPTPYCGMIISDSPL